ncbi:MAG TPA: hypothetical protein VHE81_23535 [Lacipirellulaceae bacterium]|nr:hypothetical protein [Lacipirellulaceae bacterium]
MPRVASCPQCEHELLVPEGANADAWATCPECNAFFELKSAQSRELPALLLVDSESAGSVAPSAPTVPENPPAVMPTSGPPAPAGHTTNESTSDRSTAPIAEFADERGTPDVIGSDLTEIAAQRIDAWFRSAKTLSDLPQPISAPTEQSEQAAYEPQPRASAVEGLATESVVENAGIESLDTNFDLEAPLETPTEAAAWDDSQHMERLLADLENHPIESFEQVSHETPAASDEEPVQTTENWPDVPLSVPIKTDSPRSKRSLARTMLLTICGGFFGLGLGYYALLWLGTLLHRGTEIDFLDAARYLPKAILPASFSTDENPATPTARSTNMITDLAASAKSTEPQPTTGSTAPKKNASEKQAAFTESAESLKPTTDEVSDGRYAIPATKNDASPHEPAKFVTPPATPLTETRRTPDVVQIAHAPSFTANELTAALKAADHALPALVAGNLADGKQVAHAKGTSYMTIADMAQKATFTAPAASPEVMQAQQQANEFFRRALSNSHTREEVAQITPKWLSHSPRPQNGVFFAGTVTRQANKGSVAEYSVELGGGESLTVLVPLAVGREIGGSSRPVAVAGWIVERPSEQVAGYTGSALQAVFAQRLIPLE